MYSSIAYLPILPARCTGASDRDHCNARSKSISWDRQRNLARLGRMQEVGAAFPALLAPQRRVAVAPPVTALMPAPTRPTGSGGGFEDDGHGGQLGAALLPQCNHNLQGTRIFPDNGAVWAGVMGVTSACLPAEAEGSGSGLLRVLGLVPHLASRAMGIVWEQEAEDDGELSWEDGVPPQVRGGFFPGDSCFTISHIIPIFPFNGPSQSISTSFALLSHLH